MMGITTQTLHLELPTRMLSSPTQGAQVLGTSRQRRNRLSITPRCLLLDRCHLRMPLEQCLHRLRSSHRTIRGSRVTCLGQHRHLHHPPSKTSTMKVKTMILTGIQRQRQSVLQHLPPGVRRHKCLQRPGSRSLSHRLLLHPPSIVEPLQHLKTHHNTHHRR